MRRVETRIFGLAFGLVGFAGLNAQGLQLGAGNLDGVPAAQIISELRSEPGHALKGTPVRMVDSDRPELGMRHFATCTTVMEGFPVELLLYAQYRQSGKLKGPGMVVQRTTLTAEMLAEARKEAELAGDKETIEFIDSGKSSADFRIPIAITRNTVRSGTRIRQFTLIGNEVFSDYALPWTVKSNVEIRLKGDMPVLWGKFDCTRPAKKKT